MKIPEAPDIDKFIKGEIKKAPKQKKYFQLEIPEELRDQLNREAKLLRVPTFEYIVKLLEKRTEIKGISDIVRRAQEMKSLEEGYKADLANLGNLVE